MGSTDNKIKHIIGELLRIADNTSRKVLTAFDSSRDPDDNIQVLSKLSRTTLDECAVLFSVDSKSFSNREKLSRRIVFEILALFPTKCSDCSEEYTIKLGENPTLRCFICLQGSHDCEELTASNELMRSNPVSFSTVW